MAVGKSSGQDAKDRSEVDERNVIGVAFRDLTVGVLVGLELSMSNLLSKSFTYLL
jgi:hypothetical protein